MATEYKYNKRRELLFGLKADIARLESQIDNGRAGFPEIIKSIIEKAKELRYVQHFESLEFSKKNNQIWGESGL